MRSLLLVLALLLGPTALAAAQPGQPAEAPTTPTAEPSPGAAGREVAPSAPAAAGSAPTTAAKPKGKREMPPVPPRTDEEPETFWLPQDASTQASDVDYLYYGILALSVICFVAITVVTVWFAWKYRFRKGHAAEHSSS